MYVFHQIKIKSRASQISQCIVIKSSDYTHMHRACIDWGFNKSWVYCRKCNLDNYLLWTTSNMSYPADWDWNSPWGSVGKIMINAWCKLISDPTFLTFVVGKNIGTFLNYQMSGMRWRWRSHNCGCSGPCRGPPKLWLSRSYLGLPPTEIKQALVWLHPMHNRTLMIGAEAVYAVMMMI